MKIWTIYGYSAVLLAVLMPTVVLGQEIKSLADIKTFEQIEEGFRPLATTTAPYGTVSCFDYYTFGSVQATLLPVLKSTVSGAKTTFNGFVENKNPYPIVDAAVYGKVFRVRSENDGNGPDVVDIFIIKEGLSIPARGSVPVNFTWNAPAFTVSGKYQLATYVTVAKRFNLSGLTFTDDIVGSLSDFEVVGEQKAAVAFEKSDVTVNGKPHHFAAFSKRVGNEPVVVQARVENTSNETQTARLSWFVYNWDAQMRQNVVQEKTESVTVPAKGSKTVQIEIVDSQYPVYMARADLLWKGTRSIIDVRFVRENIDRVRVNFPGVTKFPIVAGEENVLFSCVHNSGTANSVPNNRLEIILFDKNWDVIHTYKYAGHVTGQMMGVADTFISKKTYDVFTLVARVFSGETLLDEVELTYDCQDINPSLCRSKEEVSSFKLWIESIPLQIRYAFFGLVFLLCLLAGAVYKRIHT